MPLAVIAGKWKEMKTRWKESNREERQIDDDGDGDDENADDNNDDDYEDIWRTSVTLSRPKIDYTPTTYASRDIVR